jgi:hypothetical protein
LRNLEAVRRELADVVHGIKGRTIDLGEGRVLTYALSTIAGVIETSREQGELAARIARLEDLLATRTGSAGWRPAQAAGNDPTKGASA